MEPAIGEKASNPSNGSKIESKNCLLKMSILLLTLYLIIEGNTGSPISKNSSSGNAKRNIMPVANNETRNISQSDEGKVKRHSRSVPIGKEVRHNGKQNSGSLPVVAGSVKNSSSSKNIRRQAPSIKH